MKPSYQALAIFQNKIRDYQSTCKKSDGQILSNTMAFFINRVPFLGHRGGIDGYYRAQDFIDEMNEKRRNGELPTTRALMSFAINYPNKGHELSEYIWKAIRECAGFIDAKHIEKYIRIYQWDRLDFIGKDPVWPSDSESRAAIKDFIHDAIRGFRSKELVKVLGIKYPPHPKPEDYAKLLLNRLNYLIPNVKEEVVPKKITYNKNENVELKTWAPSL